MPGVIETVLEGTAQLAQGPHPERARRDAETLLLQLLSKDRAWLIAHGQDELREDQAAGYVDLLARRQSGEPIQYITGAQEFFGLAFHVTPAVLIPRPETEHLVERALELAARVTGFVLEHDFSRAESSLREDRTLQAEERRPDSFKEGPKPTSVAKATLGSKAFMPGINPGPTSMPIFSAACSATAEATCLRILDVGTGSGAIAVALAHNLPQARITAVDISTEALAIARENATRNGVADRIQFLQGDLLSCVSDAHFDLIVSNPPYVPAIDRESLSVEVREHEPALALFAGEDGLAIYRRLIPEAFAALGQSGFLALEIGYAQSEAVYALLAQAGFATIEVTPDLQGIPRVLSAQKP